MVQVAPDIDEKLEAVTEDSPVHTSLLRDFLQLPVRMRYHHLLFQRTVRVCREIGVARLFIEAIDLFHHKLVRRYLPQQLSVQVVEVKMVVAVALAGQQDMLIRDTHIVEHVFLDILINFVLDSQLAHRRERVCHIDAQHVLMTVHRHDGHLGRIACGLDAGDIAVGIERHADLARLMRLDIIAHDLHLRIYLSWHRILVSIVAWIFGILLAFRGQPFEELHGILLHGTLVIAYPHDLPGISREHHRRVGGELLLIHPVGDAVDHLVAPAVFGHLTLGIVVEQLHKVDVVLSHEGNLIAIWREHWCLLGASVAERHQLVVTYVEDIIHCRERTPIDRLRGRLNQHSAPIGTQDIAFHTVQLMAARR